MQTEHTLLNKSKEKLSFKFVKRDGKFVTYEASFWNGWEQKYEHYHCVDLIVDTDVFGNPIPARLLNTSPGVSYYSELKKKAKF